MIRRSASRAFAPWVATSTFLVPPPRNAVARNASSGPAARAANVRRARSARPITRAVRVSTTRSVPLGRCAVAPRETKPASSGAAAPARIVAGAKAVSPTPAETSAEPPSPARQAIGAAPTPATRETAAITRTVLGARRVSRTSAPRARRISNATRERFATTGRAPRAVTGTSPVPPRPSAAPKPVFPASTANPVTWVVKGAVTRGPVAPTQTAAAGRSARRITPAGRPVRTPRTVPRGATAALDFATPPPASRPWPAAG